MAAPPVLPRDPDRRAFLLRRLHSLSGVMPLGMFLVGHLWTNAAALGGQAPYDHAVRTIEGLPALGAVEIVLVFLPLTFHASYGVALAVQAKADLKRYPYAAHWLYVLQRASGVAALGFILWHLSEYRLPKLFGQLDGRAFYPVLAARLSSIEFGVPWVAFAYVLGVGACVVHLANGLLGFCTSWGLAVSARGRRVASYITGVIGLVLLVLGVATTFHFATGALALGRPDW